MQASYSDFLSKKDSMMSDSLRQKLGSAPSALLEVTITSAETGIELVGLPIISFSASRTGCELQLDLSHQDMKKIQDSFRGAYVVKCLNYSGSVSLHRYKIEKSLTNMLLVTLEFTDC